MYIIVLTGMPASGKSTIAKVLSKEFNIPILEKDKIKEALFDTIGFESYAQKRMLDHAANAVLLSVCESMMISKKPVILDNNFDKISSEALEKLLEIYHYNCVSVVLKGDIEVFYNRYVQRDNWHKRHLGHVLQDHYPPKPSDCLDYSMTRAEFDEKFTNRGMADFECGCTKIEVDATNPDDIDMNALLSRISEEIAALLP